MTTHLDEARERLALLAYNAFSSGNLYDDKRRSYSLADAIIALVYAATESRPSSEPPATAGGAPKVRDTAACTECGGVDWHAPKCSERGAPVTFVCTECSQPIDPAERYSLPRIEGWFHKSCGRIVWDRAKAPPPPAPAEKCPEPLPEDVPPLTQEMRARVERRVADRLESSKPAVAAQLREIAASRPSHGTGTADPDATGGGAEFHTCPHDAALHHVSCKACARRLQVLIDAGAASQQKKVEAYRDALRACVAACLIYQRAPMAEDHTGRAATRCADDISRIVLVATLRRELNGESGREGKT